MNRAHSFAWIIAATLCGLLAPRVATSSEHYARTLPSFALSDPTGRTFTREQLLHSGLILVVTAPTITNKESQEGWHRLLSHARYPQLSRVVFIEDLSAALFKEAALFGMRQAYRPQSPPLLLIDTDGELRTKLRVGKEETVVLVYDQGGRLVYADASAPNHRSVDAIRASLK